MKDVDGGDLTVLHTQLTQRVRSESEVIMLKNDEKSSCRPRAESEEKNKNTSAFVLYTTSARSRRRLRHSTRPAIGNYRPASCALLLASTSSGRA